MRPAHARDAAVITPDALADYALAYAADDKDAMAKADPYVKAHWDAMRESDKLSMHLAAAQIIE